MATELPQITVEAEETPPEKPIDTGPDTVVPQQGSVTAVESGAPIRTQSSDGVTHEFPAGTADDIVDKAMKAYAQEHADKTTTLGQMGVGFADPVEGGGQLVSNLVPESIRGTLDTFNNWAAKHTGGLIRELPPGGKNQQMQEREAAIQEQRGANKDNIDWSRMGGDLLNPINYLGGGGIGGASKLLNIGRAGLAGATSSAIQPVSDPDYWREKSKQAVIGTVFGLGMGGAAGAIGQGLDAIGAYLARKNPEFLDNEVIKKVIKRIAQDQKAGGPSAQDMIDLVNAQSGPWGGGKPITLADKGGANVKGLAGNVARQPGESRAIAIQLIGKRDEVAAQRISQDIETYMHGGPSSRQTQEMLLNARSSAATPLYDEAFKLQNIWSPRLQNFIDDLDFKEGLARGWHSERRRALAEGRDITSTQMGVDIDMATGQPKIIAVPNMRLLDMAKRGLDEMIADARDPITGRLNQRGKELNDVRRAYIKEIEDADRSGIYRRARAAWEGPSASRDAVQLGRAVFQHSPEEMAAEVAKLSPANREFGRIGVADMLKERLAKTGLSGDEAKAIIKNPWMRDQLRPWFRSREDFAKFTDSISTETEMFETGHKMLGGSQTAERVAEDTSVENAYSAAKIIRDITGGKWGALRAAADAWRLFRDLGKGDDLVFNEKIAQILFATRISPETASKLTGQTPLNIVNPLEKTGQAVSKAGVPAAAALGVPQAKDRGSIGAPQQNPGGGNQIPGKQSSLPQSQRQVLSDAGPDPVRPGAQYAANEPQSALPSPPESGEGFLSDADQAAEARGAAAQRQRQAVKPAEGRQEDGAAESFFDMIPGRSVVRSIGQGEYGEAAIQAGASAMPIAGKAISAGVSAAMKAAPGLTKTVAAATGALTGLLTGSEAGKIPLDPEQRKRLQMEQQSLKQKQDAAEAAAKQRLQEAEQKAKIDSDAAERSAKTETERQKLLAEIENNKQREQAEIIAKRHKEEEDAAQRSLDAAKAESKRMAERPFREKYPEAALGLTLGGMAVAAMLPTLSNAQKATALNKYIAEWKKLDASAAKALESGTAQEKQIAVQRLSDASNKWVETKERLSKPTSTGTKLAYGMAGAEGAALPAEIDFGLQPKESEAHKSAEEFFTNPMEMARVIATYLGGTMAGMTASKYPFKSAEPPVGSGGLVKAWEEQKATEKKAAAAAKSAETRAKKKAEAEKAGKKEPEEPRKAKVPKDGPKIYGLRE